MKLLFKYFLFLLAGIILVYINIFLFKTIPVNAESLTTPSFTNNLLLDSNKQIVYNIDINTSVEDILTMINTNGEINILDKDNNILTSGSLKTGDKIKITLSDETLTYKISVRKDIDGNGKFDTNDITKLSKYLLNNNSIKEDEYIYAGDIISNNKIDINDIISMVKSFKNNDIVEVTQITLDNNNISLHMAENKTLNATIYPNNATDKNITWTSSNENVATVKNGQITAQNVGTATITATTSNGKQATCTIQVKNLDRIHFIGNGTAFSTFINQSNVSGAGPSPSETIVLESNGKFALIDTGLSNSNDLNPDRAKNVINYLISLGAKKLDFILITHVHYDHMGGASYILDNINVEKFYTKVYYANDSSTDSSKINNINRYNDVYNKTNNIGIFEKINATYEGKVLTLGNMKINLYATKNMQYYDGCNGEDENINSILTYIVVNNKKILLTGDMEPTTNTCLNKFNPNCSGTSITECIVTENNIKDIDLLKLPHHGYSSCDINELIINTLNTKYIVIDNWSSKVNYYYKGITNNNNETFGPFYEGSKSCRAKYFSSYPTSGDNKTAYYVNNNNIVFDFTNSTIDIYNN